MGALNNYILNFSYSLMTILSWHMTTKKARLKYITGHVNTSCETGWRYGVYNCYMFSVDMLNFFDASKMCEGLHSKLITVESTDEAVSNQ